MSARNQNPSAEVGMQNEVVSVENSVAVLKTLRQGYCVIQRSGSAYTGRGTDSRDSSRHSYSYVHSSTTHSRQEGEAT